MESRGLTRSIAMTLFADVAVLTALVIPLRLAAQDRQDFHHARAHHHYKLVDMGTFGGPGGGISNPSSSALNRRGALVGVSDTSVADPFTPNCFNPECFVWHSFMSRNGTLTELMSLPGGASNFAASINDHGQIAGESQNGAIDPLTGWPEANAVIWQHGHISDLGTLGGNQSNANANNNRAQVVGAALNMTPDPFANTAVASCIFYYPYGGCGTFAQMFLFAPAATESHAFLWTQKQGMHDLGTLGGPDSGAWIINDRGQIAGESFTSFTPNPSSGIPTIDPFLWDPKQKKIIDLGSLGGTFGFPLWMNSRGEVVGSSNPAGDMTQHPFLWTEARGMQDLGTFYGPSGFGAAFSVNDDGEVVGQASSADNTVLVAFLWKNNVMTNLGTIGAGTCSSANSINLQGQIVGAAIDPAFDCSEELRGLLWDDGGPPVDLNTLVVPGTAMFVTSGIIINDAGEIGCLGLNPGDTDGHACLLIPCDENHSGIEGCDYSLGDTTAALSRDLTNGTQRLAQSRRTNRYHIRGVRRADSQPNNVGVHVIFHKDGATVKTALTLATSSRGGGSPCQTKRTYPLASAILLGICVVAAASAQAQMFSVLYEFTGPPDGFYPYQETLLEVNGIFYGTTYYGGTGCCGTVFKVNSNGKETVLHSFAGGTTDVTSPNGGLVRDKGGNLYGVAPFGGHSSCGRHGAVGCGAVFKLDMRGKETVFYEFPMGSAGWVPQGLIIDSAGNLYGATFYGGTEGCIYGCGLVFKLDPSGNKTVLYKFIGGIEGGNPTGLLTRDLAGNLYGATNRGGDTTCQPYGCGVVFKLDPSGKETPLYSFTGGADGAYPNGSLVLDVNGNLYGTTGGGGDPRCDCGVVFEVTTAGKEKVLHTFKGADGANPAAGLLYAKGNAYSTTTYGGTSNLGTVFELTSRGVEKVLHSFSGSDGGMPYSGLVMDAKGNVYGTTTVGGPSNSGTVFKIVP